MGTSYARGCLVMWSMKQYFVTALLALIILLPARAQLFFSDSLRVSLLTCTAGPDTYERFGHAAIRINDLHNPQLDLTFHYGVFSFDAPNFIYRFVKGETDYQLGIEDTERFIARYNYYGLGMTEQILRLDSAQTSDLVQRLLINYRPENRTYRYSYFFDNCSTRPYHIFNASTGNTIQYDSTWVNAITLREMVQQCSGTGNWLDFGIALAVANRADLPTTYEEQMFLPAYLSQALDHATIPVTVGDETVMLPVVAGSATLLEMTDEVSELIAAPDPIAPTTVFAILLMLGMVLTALEQRNSKADKVSKAVTVTVNTYDTVFFLALGLTGIIVWFLNFFSLHPAVDHNINCFWLLPTHVIFAILLWFRPMQKASKIYFGITFALVILYVIFDWIIGQYCPPAFLLLLATILLRSFARYFTPIKK